MNPKIILTTCYYKRFLFLYFRRSPLPADPPPAYEQVSVQVLENVGYHSNTPAKPPDQNRNSYTNQAYEEIPHDIVIPIDSGSNKADHVPVHPTESSDPNDMAYEVIRNSTLATLTDMTLSAPDAYHLAGASTDGENQDSKKVVPMNTALNEASEYHLAQATTKDNSRSDSKEDAVDSMPLSEKSSPGESTRPASILVAENTVYESTDDHKAVNPPAKSVGGQESYPYEEANLANDSPAITSTNDETKDKQGKIPTSTLTDKGSDYQLAKPTKDDVIAAGHQASNAALHTNAAYELAQATGTKENAGTDSIEMVENSSPAQLPRPGSILVAENMIYEGTDDPKDGHVAVKSQGDQKNYSYEEANPVTQETQEMALDSNDHDIKL